MNCSEIKFSIYIFIYTTLNKYTKLIIDRRNCHECRFDLVGCLCLYGVLLGSVASSALHWTLKLVPTDQVLPREKLRPSGTAGRLLQGANKTAPVLFYSFLCLFALKTKKAFVEFFWCIVGGIGCCLDTQCSGKDW